MKTPGGRWSPGQLNLESQTNGVKKGSFFLKWKQGGEQTANLLRGWQFLVCLFIYLFIYWFIYLFISLLIHLLIYSFTYLFICLSFYWFIYLLIYLFIYFFAYSFTYLFIYLFIHLLIYSFTYLFIDLFIYWFIYLFISLLIHLLIYSFTYLFIYLFIHLLIYLLIYLFIDLFMCLFTYLLFLKLSFSLNNLFSCTPFCVCTRKKRQTKYDSCVLGNRWRHGVNYGNRFLPEDWIEVRDESEVVSTHRTGTHPKKTFTNRPFSGIPFIVG